LNRKHAEQEKEMLKNFRENDALFGEIWQAVEKKRAEQFWRPAKFDSTAVSTHQ
jgi:hypothetical protein